jgi:hypothetical protein
MSEITSPINLDATQQRIATAMETMAQQTTLIAQGKADKVNNPTSGNFAGLDGNGNPTDSGKKPSDFATAAQGTKIDNITSDMAYAGSGLGSCSTAATTAAKTVTLAHYILLKNVPVSVFFQNGVNIAGATLNINAQGAKPIVINGSAIQPGVIRPRTTVTFVYDGTNYNVICMGGLEQSDDDSELWVDMGLPSGLKWAKKNIDVTQANGFAASEYQYECTFFSWGNTEGHNPANASSFTYDWGSSNDGPYASTPGAALTGNIPPSMDAARANLGAPWRMPTTDEYAELFNNIEYLQADGTTTIPTSTANKLVTVNSIVGIYLKSKINGKKLFFPCSGDGDGTSWNNRGSRGSYWAAALYSATNGRYLLFRSGGVYPQYNGNRFYGFSVRAVQ